MKKINIILAMSREHLIGVGNEIPWSLSDDYTENFVPKTAGCPCIMGRSTADTLKRPLKGRTCIVLSRNPSLKREGFIYANSVADAIIIANNSPGDTIWCIGGREIYELFEERFTINEYHITIVHGFKDCKEDRRRRVYFVRKNNGYITKLEKEFKKREPNPAKPGDRGNSHDFSIYVLSRIKYANT